ncbi:MAG: hypothetical protein NWE91_02665 [Candidatus Bathyarchaeota archaeon]|nr:hypothetical protein [Candidatus Bathyarchaeota archaeon]
MSQEEFKSIRITLSDEAFERLERIMKDATFRSYSSTIEECVRVVSDLMTEIYHVAGRRDTPDVNVNVNDQCRTFERFVSRMTRFTNRGVFPGE